MGIFSFLFGGKYTATAKYEALLNRRKAEAEHFDDFAQSDTLARYYELDKLVSSADFAKRVDTLKNEKFSQTEAYRKLTDYTALKKDAEIKDYLKMSASGKAERTDRILQSASYARYVELQALVASPDFAQAKAQKDFKKSEAYRQLTEFKKLKKDSDIRFAEKTKDSTPYRHYKSIVGSPKLQTYEQLDTYIHSSEFINYRREIEDRNRYRKSEECRLANEYEALKKDKDIRWYLAAAAKNEYAEEKTWKLTFEDDFERLDDKKWSHGYFWGKALLGDSYVTENEKQCFRPANVTAGGSAVCIDTRPEKCSGKVWSATRGFGTADFEYTSGMINSGSCFRQKYGKVMVKIKAGYCKGLLHSIYMVGEKSAPQIDLMCYGAGRKDEMTVGVRAEAGKSQLHRVDGLRPDTDYILTLEWDNGKMTWAVNGTTVATQTTGVPDVPMYLAIGSCIVEEPKAQVAGRMCIDWIKCYAK